MILSQIVELSLPLTNPVLKFLLILVIILFAPILLNKFKIPPLLGLIIAGAVIGPFGFNLMERDSSIILSGTAGLLYIMFLAGLEIDLVDFKKNRNKSIVFGLYTFTIPMTLGILSGLYILGFSTETSVLLASMFASHTLIAYPLISKLGVAKNKAVNITVGGTMITDVLALLVLAVIVGMTTGEVNTEFWLRLSISIVVFGLIVTLLFPIIGRWFFKRFDDNVSQYIFVLAMVFLGAVLAEIAGIEAIIGAFLAGLALNRLIPHTSPLMNRIEFVGNAIFIPFFLIGVGMLIDYRVFFKDMETIKVASVMIVVATSSKFLAAWLTQKTYKLSVNQRRLIFGLSNAQAAATLAAVLVGYNIILGETETGEPIRLLSESILSGTILMILFTCTIASFVAQKGAKNIVLAENLDAGIEEEEEEEKILIPISNIDTMDELINLGVTIKSKKNKEGLYALSIVDNKSMDGSAHKQAKKLLNMAAVTASATDHLVHQLLRYDLNIVNGITSVVKEHKMSDLILGLHIKKGISDSFLGHLTTGILTKCNTTTLIYKPAQPLNTIKRHIIIVPENAEKETGFLFWLIKVWNIARNSGAKLLFYGNIDTLEVIKVVQSKHPIECDFIEFNDWNDFLILLRNFHKDDNLIIVMSRRDKISYHSNMTNIPTYLNNYFKDTSYILIYPMQAGITDHSKIDLTNPTFLEPLDKLEDMGKTIAKLFRSK
ncbi:Glutathione-regulated potassium-efflux system protein KefB [Arenibacter antarcticus]|uniref:Cation:proton antiporter n=1 Tax=Arenibacter antarcticus TaxID=2040469 RepID=A0ABW5VGD2_9FLAO|nr:cation:proton antiporter [Arenibacter sp. H213]MCM4166515.1 sodium:proton antiporter [Arenibacter sp. H213]